MASSHNPKYPEINTENVHKFIELNGMVDNSVLYGYFGVVDKELYKSERGSIRVFKSNYKKMLLRKKKALEEAKLKHEEKQKEANTKAHQAKGGKNEKGEDTPLLPTQFIDFPVFMRWFSEPAYRGMFQWQHDHHRETWGIQVSPMECQNFNQFEMTLVPRDHGKSIEYTGKYQWAMQYCYYDVLLLGWTERRKQVALYVYNFFDKYGLIEVDKRTSPFHFRIKNGGRFDCFLITSKETLGMHSEGELNRFEDLTEEEWKEFTSLFSGNEDDMEKEFTEEEIKAYIESRQNIDRKLWISIDDPIDITFMKERHKEEMLELKFNSQLYSINPDKWSFTGTHKFEGDIFDFFEAKFGKQMKIYKKKPIDEEGNLLCPERFTHPSKHDYAIDILPYKAVFDPSRNAIVPILDKNGKKIKKSPKKDLQAIRNHIGEYAWFSEWEQDPHPVEGGILSDIQFFNMLDDPVNRKYDYCIITIDRATTVNTTSDYTGYVIELRHGFTGVRYIIDDRTGNWTIDDLLHDVNMYATEFRAKHEDVGILLVVEKQGGGDDFIHLCINQRKYIWTADGQEYINHIRELCIICEVHNTTKKTERIKNRLEVPIRNGMIKIHISQRNSEVVHELRDYPNSPKVDAIDGLANAERELLEFPISLGDDNFQESYLKAYEYHEHVKEQQASQRSIMEMEQRNDPRKRVGRSVF